MRRTSKKHKEKLRHILVLVIIIVFVVLGVIELTTFINENTNAQMIVSKLGYLGVLGIAIIAGLNIFLPFPAAAFVPIFTAAGLWLPLITLMLIIGTTIADCIGYLIGKMGKDFVATEYPTTYKRFLRITTKNHRLLLPFIFIYAAFVPLPNEAFLIPIAMMGVPLRTFIIPLVAGTVVHQTVLAYSVQGIFNTLLGIQ